MNIHTASLVLIATVLTASMDATAQCRKFSKKTVISAVDANLDIDQITAGMLGRGETAAAVLEVESTGEVDLIISTHPDLGEVHYSVVNVGGDQLASGVLSGNAMRLPVEVEANNDLIVHIASERPNSAYTPLGCVSLATTKVIPNEMDILMGQ